MIALYPIKPAYIEKILSGEKRFELRRKLPKHKVEFIVLYSTVPESQVVGYAKVKDVHKSTPDGLWSMVCASAGISRCDYDDYFSGTDYANAIELENVYRFVSSFDLKLLGEELSVPQSFCYLDKQVFKRIKRRKSVEV
jgi:predicted transcriptional regulator